MKNNIFLLLIMSLFFQSLEAQRFPETFNYQAVARRSDGTSISEVNIVVEVNIIQGNNCATSEGCNLVWQELHYPKTNAFGLFSINIGNGQTTFSGSETNFESIKWDNLSQGNFYLKVRVDFGTSEFVNGLLDIGTIFLQSVPYSLNSQTALNITRNNGKVPLNFTELQDVDINTPVANDVLIWDGTRWTNKDISADGVAVLNDLTDVTISGQKSSQVLLFDGSIWRNTDLDLSNIANFNISGLGNNDILQWDGTMWKNKNLSMSLLSDVDISSVTAGQILSWSGTHWENKDASENSVWKNTTGGVYYNGTKNVGIGTDAPASKFHVELSNNEGIMASGIFSASSVISSVGAGSRMTYYPSKGAFRAGVVDGTQWDNNFTGSYSSAFGCNTTASGSYSSAFGYKTTASGVAGFTTGTLNDAKGMNSIVAGNNNISGNNSIIGGSSNKDNSNNNFLTGQENTNYGSNSIIFGTENTNSANNVLIGGSNASVSANNSVAFGVKTKANSYCSLVIGRYNSTSAASNSAWIDSEPVFVIGNGTSDFKRHNVLVIRKDGNIYTMGKLFETIPNPSKSASINNFSDILLLSTFKSSNSTFGIEASQVKKYFPNLIANFNEKKAINYTGFIPLIIETLKQQNLQIKELQNENLELKNKLSNIEERLKSLETNQN